MHYQTKVFCPPTKIFISHPKSVIFNETSSAPQWFYLLY